MLYTVYSVMVFKVSFSLMLSPVFHLLAFSPLPFPPAGVVSEIVISATTHFGAAAGHRRADSHNVFFLSVSVRGHATLFEGACGRSVASLLPPSSEEEEPICFSHMTQFLLFVEARARVAGSSSYAEILVPKLEALKQSLRSFQAPARSSAAWAVVARSTTNLSCGWRPTWSGTRRASSAVSVRCSSTRPIHASSGRARPTARRTTSGE